MWFPLFWKLLWTLLCGWVLLSALLEEEDMRVEVNNVIPGNDDDEKSKEDDSGYLTNPLSLWCGLRENK